MHINTKLTQLGRGSKNRDAISVNVPVMRASTIIFKDHDTWNKYKDLRKKERVLSYGARGTETSFELEKLLCELEGGQRAQLFPTGLAALGFALLYYAKSGAHFVITDGIYGPVKTICDNFLKNIGVEISFAKADASDIEDKVKPNTNFILCESPGSILYEIIDLPKLCDFAHKKNIAVGIDSTYASAYLCNPLKLGADLSIIAGTKYLSGHSDVMLGAVISAKREGANFSNFSESFGMISSPDDCYLVLRGLRTLGIRLKKHEENADKITEFLKSRSEINAVFYPKLKEHKNNNIFMRDFKGTNGLVSVEFKKQYNAKDIAKFIDRLDHFGVGASWGGFESLATINTPPRYTQDIASMGTIVRFHVGLEDVDDLINDLEQSFNKLKG